MSLSADQHRAIISLAADKAAAEFARECRAEGLRWLLLKGPSIAGRLYLPDEHRPYVDLDVLVAPSDYGRAEAILTRLGYREAPHLPRQRVEHASPWRAPRKVPVDLHRRVPHTPADPDLAWDVLVRDSETLRVASEDVEILNLEALALLVTLHALHHGTAVPKPLKDLSLAAGRLDSATWRAAYALAQAVGAERNFAAGLTLTPAARARAQELGLPRMRGWEITLRSGDPARLASAFRLLRETRGLSQKLEALRDELVPDSAVSGKARDSAGTSRTRAFLRRLALVAGAGPGAFAAWLIERSDVRRFRRRSRG